MSTLLPPTSHRAADRLPEGGARAAERVLRLEEALRRSEAFLREVQRLSRTGGWSYDAATGLVESSPEIQRAFAVQPGEDISRPSFWFGRIHPDDRAHVQAEFERCLSEKAEYRARFRIVLPDGSIRYQQATGHPVTDD